MQRWLLEHYFEHLRLAQALAERANPVSVVVLPIDRMQDPDRWNSDHQRMTQAVWSGLGGGVTTDFEHVDWSDPISLGYFFDLHAQWHRMVRTELGLE